MKFEFIISKANEIKNIFMNIDLDRLKLPREYSDYLSLYINDLDYILIRYSNILYSSCAGRDSKELNLLDFGGGTGIMAFLAKRCGMPYVVYMDISVDMCSGTQQVARLCDIPLDEYYVGSYENIENICSRKFDVIANFDVLEHLYNPMLAFGKLRSILNNNGAIFMATNANKYNPIMNYLYKKFHNTCENIGGHKPPFMKIRQEIIKNYTDELSDSKVRDLAFFTRGKRKEDIIGSVENYIKTGKMPELIDKSNTCDPITGSGAENLLDVFQLAHSLKKMFNYTEIGTGYYPITKSKFVKYRKEKKNIINKMYPYLHFTAQLFAPILNCLIHILPLRLKLIITPYYYIKVYK
jgi:2-polyprenyl-3-methyl-5-hydroxy-6-metoxy-1,4-benzoquinol methylase